MLFNQIKHRSDNFSYIIADEGTRETVVVDPDLNVEAILRILSEQNLKAKYVVDTHHHADHTAGNEDIKLKHRAKIIAHKLSKVRKDLEVVDGDIIKAGTIDVKVIHTPGHTPDSICLLVENKLLTGDTLFVGECGRTDLSGGSARDMYNSLFNKLLRLRDEIEVYPGHDYGSRPNSTIGQERKTNYTLEKRTLDEFIEFMKEP